jgi:hypothetical protein
MGNIRSTRAHLLKDQMDEGLFPVSFNGGVIAPGIWVVPNNSLGIRVTAPAVSFGNCAQMADSTAVQTSGVNISIGLTVAACAVAAMALNHAGAGASVRVCGPTLR